MISAAPPGVVTLQVSAAAGRLKLPQPPMNNEYRQPEDNKGSYAPKYASNNWSYVAVSFRAASRPRCCRAWITRRFSSVIWVRHMHGHPGPSRPGLELHILNLNLNSHTRICGKSTDISMLDNTSGCKHISPKLLEPSGKNFTLWVLSRAAQLMNQSCCSSKAASGALGLILWLIVHW